MTNELKLTENEKVFLQEIKKEFYYRKYKSMFSKEYELVEGCETNDDGKELCRKSSLGSRVARGVLSSLTKKEILSYAGLLPENRNCWNPIYKDKNYDLAMQIINN